MEMHRVCSIRVIDEAHNCFFSFVHHESRARYYSIIADVPRLSQVGIDLNVHRLDVNLIVIDVVVGSAHVQHISP